MDQTARNERTTLTVPMVDPEIVTHLRALRALGWGTKRIARELGIARDSVRRYLRDGVDAETQTRPGAWTLDAEQQLAARTLLDGPAAGNTVVVQRLLAAQQVPVPLRTLQRVLAPHRQAKRAAELATVRFETAPGHQLQIDFGEKWIDIAGVRTKVHVFVAVLRSRAGHPRADSTSRSSCSRTSRTACATPPDGSLLRIASSLVVAISGAAAIAASHVSLALCGRRRGDKSQ